MSTQLNYINLDILEGQLARGEHLDDLYRLDGRKFPHWDVLLSYKMCPDPDLQQRWAACLFKLIELKAPVDARPGLCIGSILTSERWGPQVELTRKLAGRYLEADYFDVNQPLAGELPTPDGEARSGNGKMPLAAAIGFNNPDAVRFLCENGADWDLGATCKGGQSWKALAYAQARGAGEAAAVLMEFAMLERMDAVPAPAMYATAPARIRRAGL